MTKKMNSPVLATIRYCFDLYFTQRKISEVFDMNGQVKWFNNGSDFLTAF